MRLPALLLRGLPRFLLKLGQLRGCGLGIELLQHEKGVSQHLEVEKRICDLKYLCHQSEGHFFVSRGHQNCGHRKPNENRVYMQPIDKHDLTLSIHKLVQRNNGLSPFSLICVFCIKGCSFKLLISSGSKDPFFWETQMYHATVANTGPLCFHAIFACVRPPEHMQRLTIHFLSRHLVVL